MGKSIRFITLVPSVAGSLAVAAPAPQPSMMIGNPPGSPTKGSDCPPGSHRDAQAVEKAGGDPKALAQVPCVPDSTRPTANGELGAGPQRPRIRPAGVQPADIKPAPLQPSGSTPK